MAGGWKSNARIAEAPASRWIELHERDGVPYTVIAQRFGRSEDSIRRAIKKHRRLLAETGR